MFTFDKSRSQQLRYRPSLVMAKYSKAANARLLATLERGTFFNILSAIQVGANPDLRSSAGETALLRYAASPAFAKEVYPGMGLPSGDWQPKVGTKLDRKSAVRMNVEHVRFLLDAGADPNAAGSRTNKGTPLEASISHAPVEVTQLLLSRGADPNICSNPDRGYPIHAAARRGDANLVRMLIEAGARIDVKNSSGRTPLDMPTNAEVEKVLKLAAKGKLKASKSLPIEPAAPPKALVDFMSTNAAKLSGQHKLDLPNYEAGGSFRLAFLKKPSRKLFEEMSVDDSVCANYHVLARVLPESEFLVVHGSKPTLPVLLYEQESGQFRLVAKSLAIFVKRLSNKA